MTTTENGKTTASRIDRLKKKTREAWDDFWPRYGRLIHNIFHRCNLHQREWEDVKQDLFLKLYLKISCFTPNPDNPSLRPWLRAFVRHYLSDHYRRNKHQLVALDDAQLEKVSLELADQFDALIEKDWLASILVKVLDELPRMEREVVTLWLEGKTHEEVVREKGVAKGTVHVYISKFRKKCREMKLRLSS